MFLRFKMSEADYNRAVGQYITTKRMEAGFSQIELANKANISRSTMSDLEKGNRLPSGKDILSLCRVLEVTPNDIYSCGGKRFAFENNSDLEVDEHIRDFCLIIQSAYCFFKLNKASKESIHDVIYKMALSEHGEEFAQDHELIFTHVSSFLKEPDVLNFFNDMRKNQGKEPLDKIDFESVIKHLSVMVSSGVIYKIPELNKAKP